MWKAMVELVVAMGIVEQGEIERWRWRGKGRVGADSWPAAAAAIVAEVPSGPGISEQLQEAADRVQ